MQRTHASLRHTFCSPCVIFIIILILIIFIIISYRFLMFVIVDVLHSRGDTEKALVLDRLRPANVVYKLSHLGRKLFGI
jgi:hypothetical protein